MNFLASFPPAVPVVSTSHTPERCARRGWSRWMLFLLSTFAFTAPAAAADPPSPLAFTFNATGVEIRGCTPRATVYVYSIAREPLGWRTSVVPRETRLSDDDGDGRVTWDLRQPLPWRSLWFAVDLESGAYATAAPAAYTLATPIRLTSDHLRKDAAGEITQLAASASMVEFIAVRPKSGEVWGATVFSRGPNDEGTEVGRVTFSTLRLVPRAGTKAPAPKGLKNDDVIFVANSFRAEYAAVRAGEQK